MCYAASLRITSARSRYASRSARVEMGSVSAVTAMATTVSCASAAMSAMADVPATVAYMFSDVGLRMAHSRRVVKSMGIAWGVIAVVMPTPVVTDEVTRMPKMVSVVNAKAPSEETSAVIAVRVVPTVRIGRCVPYRRSGRPVRYRRLSLLDIRRDIV